MEDFSHFITEEIFLLDEFKPPPQDHSEVKSKEKPEVFTESNDVQVTIVEEPKIELLPQEPKKELSPKEPTHELGIVAGNLSGKDEELLGKILKALNMKTDVIKRSEEVDKSVNRWLVFESQAAEIKVQTIGDQQIIYSRSLSELGENVKYKKELWGLLKNHFDI